MPRATMLSRLRQSLSWHLYVLRRGMVQNHDQVRAAIRRDLITLFRSLRSHAAVA